MTVAASAVHDCVLLSTNLVRMLEAVHVGYVVARDSFVIWHDIFAKM